MRQRSKRSRWRRRDPPPSGFATAVRIDESREARRLRRPHVQEILRRSDIGPSCAATGVATIIWGGAAASFAEAVRAGAEVYASLRVLLAGKGHATGLGDEGGVQLAGDDIFVESLRCPTGSPRPDRPAPGGR
jgi:Enolase, C-terminal TIM barrel domain